MQKLPTGRRRPPTPAPRQDITSKEGTAASIRIPANTLAILGIAFSLAVIIAIVAAVKIHVRRKEEEDLYLRRQRRLERLEDIGFSSSDFEKLVAQRRVSSPPLGEKGKKGRGRRRKNPFSVELPPAYAIMKIVNSSMQPECIQRQQGNM